MMTTNKNECIINKKNERLARPDSRVKARVLTKMASIHRL